jgi:hypothetical protein
MNGLIVGKGFVCVCVWWDWGLNSGLRVCKAGTLLLEPHLQSILLWLFLRWGLVNSLLWLASNLDSPNVS